MTDPRPALADEDLVRLLTHPALGIPICADQVPQVIARAVALRRRRRVLGTAVGGVCIAAIAVLATHLGADPGKSPVGSSGSDPSAATSAPGTSPRLSGPSATPPKASTSGPGDAIDLDPTGPPLVLRNRGGEADAVWFHGPSTWCVGTRDSNSSYHATHCMHLETTKGPGLRDLPQHLGRVPGSSASGLLVAVAGPEAASASMLVSGTAVNTHLVAAPGARPFRVMWAQIPTTVTDIERNVRLILFDRTGRELTNCQIGGCPGGIIP